MSEASPDPASIGPFSVVRKLGEGAMGVVFEGYDHKLERKVALKLVRKKLLHEAAVRERMTREAQAMARLSNPHVVHVYQVGEHDGGIYVAMEYVEGETLSEWLKSATRPWQLILRTVCDAGRGLAAAHSAGLVHRDFKPENVLVDASGRARVLDFGLVQSEGAADEQAERAGPGASLEHELAVTNAGAASPQVTQATAAATEPLERSNALRWSTRLTQMGNVLGTPAYMSPEQHFGRPAGPTSDQFSFSITLYEALYGVRPFNGESWAAIRTQVQDGLVPPPPLESPVPRRLFKVLQRGLALEPEARWPSLAAMIAALEHDPWRAPLRVAAVAGLIGVASVASYAMAKSQAEDEQRCAGEAGQITGVWDPARESAVARAFDATHLPYAADTAARVKLRLDTYSRAWLDARRKACEEQVRTHSTRLMDLRIACLDRRKARLAALVDVFAAADKGVVENAVQAAAALPSLRACSDTDDLLAVSQPDDPEVAQRVAALQGQLARADALDNTARYAEGLQLVSEVRREAASLGYAPLKAEAALSDGRLKMAAVGGAEAEAALAEAVRLGIANDLYAVAAEAAIIRLYIVGNDLGRPLEAEAGALFVEALVQRARGDDQLTALFHNNLGTIHDDAGKDVEVARRDYEAALTALRRREGAHPLEAIIQHNLGIMYTNHARLEAARDHFEHARELFTSILGAAHPLNAHPLTGLGDIEVRRGAYAEAMPSYLQSIALIESTYGTEHRYLIEPLVGLGKVYEHTGRSVEAEQHYAKAVRIAEKTDTRGESVADAFAGLAELAAASGSLPQARELYERAAGAFEAALGTDSAQAARAARRAGELAGAAGQGDAAREWFERVLANKPDQPGVAGERAVASLRLAQLQAERGERGARVCELARAAEDGLPKTDRLHTEAREVARRSCD
ncbi:serine/threonine-protein kinase [Nannocystis pusilla]|uniref:Serine/threonine-protein kinase n=1 Tax=Nannocystis pusilla TaxID=889268 RepID=A0ABS7TLJ4_9BACT|nr:serine/threonine-protein kinase [Nannocystis pusilla]MBZ5709095.1 serine/threonine-protein kinase [Nannocystis pusilla]